MKIRDPKTGEEREETEDERKAREESERDSSDDGDIEKVKADRDRWRTEARKWEARAKENKGAADRLKEIEDKSKSESQRAEEARVAAEKERDDSKMEVVRLRVAMRKGLSDAQAKRLVGNTEEELEADADELLTSFKTKEEQEEQGGETIRRRPKETLRPGTGKVADPPQDVKKIVDEAMASGR